jgi:hypothetical protein
LKYSFSIYLIHANENVLDAGENALRPKSDASVWPDEYDVSRGQLENGNYTLGANIHFYDSGERDNAKSELKAIGGIINSCEPGTKIVRIKSWHDEKDANGIVPKKCEIEDIEVP